MKSLKKKNYLGSPKIYILYVQNQTFQFSSFFPIKKSHFQISLLLKVETFIIVDIWMNIMQGKGSEYAFEAWF